MEVSGKGVLAAEDCAIRLFCGGPVFDDLLAGVNVRHARGDL
jgi:hypothetical protein